MSHRLALPVLAALLAALPAAAQRAARPPAATARTVARPVFAALPAPLPGPPRANPCAFGPIDVRRYGFQPFRNPPEIRARRGTLDTTLTVRFTDPATTVLAGCPVTLRSYYGRLVGPTLRVRPGDLLAPRLANRLPRESAAEIRRQLVQEDSSAFITQVPASFNTTNLHTHGLHVSPRGRGDNVLLAIPPDSTQPYHIRLPGNHTRGTYWYHAHTHGSTAVQVGSGMAGALIVEDEWARLPPALRAASDSAHEKIFVIQNLLYDSHGRVDYITSFFPDAPPNPDGSPTSSQIACREQIDSLCTWFSSQRRETINGQIVPVIRMRPGEVQRWRLIDGSFRESVFFTVQGHALHEIALDGIYTGRVDSWDSLTAVQLQPGYRSDVLIQARRRDGSTAAEDTFQIIDAASPSALSVRGGAEPQSLIGVLVVGGAPVDMRLPTSEEMAPLNPFPGVDLSTLANQVQEVQFKLGSGLDTLESRNYFQVNYSAFTDAHRRYVKLNDVDMWSITTVGDPPQVDSTFRIGPAPHVFHIHVNPFQVRRTGPSGEPQTVWKDTQLIPPGDTVVVYTRYLDYTGAFVLHCHILDHEDLGMMEVVEVVERLPRGSTMGHGAHGRARGGANR
jgi:FtsP/CotA-like multicopper oxidase with cupredoxin domain